MRSAPKSQLSQPKLTSPQLLSRSNTIVKSRLSNTLFRPTGHRKMGSRGLDPYVMEHASKSSFWALGTSIIAFWFATALSAPKSASNPYQKLFSTHFTKVLTQRITSHPRKFTALAIYILILCLQLLEGNWVL